MQLRFSQDLHFSIYSNSLKTHNENIQQAGFSQHAAGFVCHLSGLIQTLSCLRALFGCLRGSNIQMIAIRKSDKNLNWKTNNVRCFGIQT